MKLLQWGQAAEAFSSVGGDREQEPVVLASVQGQSQSLLLPQPQDRGRVERECGSEDARPDSAGPAETVKVQRQSVAQIHPGTRQSVVSQEPAQPQLRSWSQVALESTDSQSHGG